MDKKLLKRLNSQLAASAQQDVRDEALKQLYKLMINKQQWVEEPEKDLRIIWEGLFFDYWHSDKAMYQKELAEKIAKLFTELGNIDKQRQIQWFEAFIYIFNLHWDKVDNFRIDKYLMFLRFQFNEALQFLKNNGYIHEDVQWFKDIIKKLFMEETVISKGIPLQLCDVFLQELNKVDSQNISYQNLSTLLDPFLYAVAHCRNRVLINRIVEKIFMPLLENNITEELKSRSEDSESEEEINYYDRTRPKYVDGGKLPPKTQKEISKLINEKYNFPNFNILLFAQEYLFKYAQSPKTREENRDILYMLYDKAHNLEPEPAEKELTFSQRMLLNKAKAFITKKMERRSRVQQQRKSKKILYKLGNLLSNQVINMSQSQKDELADEANDLLNDQTDNMKDQKDQLTKNILDMLLQQKNNGKHVTTNGIKNKQQQSNGTHNDQQSNGKKPEQRKEREEDEVLEIVQVNKKKNKKNKKRQQRDHNPEGDEQGDGSKKRVKWNFEQNKTREFFTYGKVATKKLPDSKQTSSPSKAAIKQYQKNKKLELSYQ